jgi:hypothetical protein
MRIPHSFLVLTVAVLLMLTGCRTYGDSGYESGPKIYGQMQQTLRQGDQDLARAQADLRRLEAAADTMPELEPMVERYRDAVTRHQQVLTEHRELVESLSASSSYRSLHRAYGGMTTDERMLRKIYDRTTRRVYAAVHGTEVDAGDGPNESTYYTNPVDLQRQENLRNRLTMQQALRR